MLSHEALTRLAAGIGMTMSLARVFIRLLFFAFILAETIIQITFLQNLNRPLLGKEEFNWSFGQVMAVAMLVTCFYGIATDVACE